MTLAEIEAAAAKCKLCELHKTRNNPVFARGNPDSGLMIVGMVPGPDEDKKGVPFIGRAGQLLDKIVGSIDIDSPYITNLVKCWLKPGLPLKNEWIAPCLQYLMAQIVIVKPRVIVTLGKDASTLLLGMGQDTKMGAIRGGVYSYIIDVPNKVDIIPTYHPSYLLRGGGEKHDFYSSVIEDFGLAEYILLSGE